MDYDSVHSDCSCTERHRGLNGGLGVDRTVRCVVASFQGHGDASARGKRAAEVPFQKFYEGIVRRGGIIAGGLKGGEAFGADTLTFGAASKAAETVLGPSMVTAQAPVPVHPPVHPEKTIQSPLQLLKALPLRDAGRRVTLAPTRYPALQATPAQFRPGGLLVTCPTPLIVVVTLKVSMAKPAEMR